MSRWGLALLRWERPRAAVRYGSDRGSLHAPWVTLVLVADTAISTWKVHLANGFFLNWTLEPGVGHGYEYHLLLLAALVCLMFTGPGAASVDVGRVRSAEAAASARARLRAGSVG